MDALEDKGRVKVAAIAPSVRVAMAEEFELEPGTYEIDGVVGFLVLFFLWHVSCFFWGRE